MKSNFQNVDELRSVHYQRVERLASCLMIKGKLDHIFQNNLIDEAEQIQSIKIISDVIPIDINRKKKTYYSIPKQSKSPLEQYAKSICDGIFIK